MPALGLLEGFRVTQHRLLVRFMATPTLKPVLIGQQASARQGTLCPVSRSDDQVWLIDQALDVSRVRPRIGSRPVLLTINDALIEQIVLSKPSAGRATGSFGLRT